jgi:hypothetical protein
VTITVFYAAYDSVLTSQSTQCVSTEKPVCATLHETIVSYCKNYTTHLNSVWTKCRTSGVKPGGTYSYHKALMDKGDNTYKDITTPLVSLQTC